jgi:hypothetical protein
MALPRNAVDRSLRILRLPIDKTVGVFDRGGNTDSVELAIDRADAAVRRFAGCVLRDEDLQRDASARRIAADERGRALELRSAADRERRRADAELREELDTAEERREQAEARADQQRSRVERERRANSRQAAQTAEQRKAAARKAAQQTEGDVAARAKKARLSELDQKAAVLDAADDAATAAGEAQRLQRTASEVKATRKSG